MQFILLLQTLEEMPFDFETSSGGLSAIDELGLAFNLDKGSSIPFSMVDAELGSQSPSAAYTKGSKTRKALVGEQQSLSNGSYVTTTGGAIGGSFPSAYA
jgi:hypothetical protein